MAEKRDSAAEIIHKLRESEVLLAQGSSIAQARKQPGVFRNTVRYEPQQQVRVKLSILILS